MTHNIISCRPSSYGKFQDKMYEHLPKLGIRYLELPLPKIEDIKILIKKLELHGLSVASIEAPCNIQSKNVVDEFKVPIDIAGKLGAQRIFVSVHAGELDKEVVYERLRRIGDLAAERSLIVMLETHPDLVTNGDVGLQTMKAVNHPNIRINYDTANMYYYNENIDGIEEMKKILNYIEGVHLKDTNGKPRTWYFPTLGEGIIDFKKIRELLNKRGFHGPFTIEIEGIEGENLTLAQTLERMEKSVDHLRKCGY
ncbi:MAG: sugar phosphate isomerase/epimerase family protein [Candidatus Bathyarchaeia archaeon]